MRYFHSTSVALCTAFLFIGTFFAPSVAAQAVDGLQIRPAIFEESADPGSSFSATLSVTNISEEEKTFFLGTQDIKGRTSGGEPIFADEEEVSPFEISAWISLQMESVTMAPGATTEIPFTVRIPENASPGSHFGMIYLDSRPDRLRETGAAVGIRIGSIVSVRISGDVIEEARMREFSTDRLIYTAPDVRFISKADNLGNVLLRPHGLIEITDMFGKKLATLEFNPSAASIFPLSEQEFVTAWQYEGFAFGRYQAILSMVYGDDGRKTLTSTASFWILPMKPLMIGLGVLLGVILALYAFVKLTIRRKLREMGIASKDSAYYIKRRSKTASTLTLAAVAIVLFCMVFLGALFFLFA